ncbi:MAG: hypothetical protein J6A21_05770 [Lentisphaeria bacterium]|nr:hypothetical protein [Lentisphaeria bacterium]
MRGMEKNYEFRAALDEVHGKIGWDRNEKPLADEIAIDGSWKIAAPEELFAQGGAGKDLEDFFRRALSLFLPCVPEAEKGGKSIVLKHNEGEKGFSIAVEENTVRIEGDTRRGVIFLEDSIRFRKAPFLKKGAFRKKNLFSPRMVHSAWGLDEYPDSHLNAILHAGFDSILVYAKGPSTTTFGHLDFNDLVFRAKKYGIGVYFYSYLDSWIDPDSEKAESLFDANFGSVFKDCPGAKGLVIVGESACFPTKDPHASPYRKGERPLGDQRPASGWWPCSDYPKWLNGVKKAVRKYDPEADIVFWSYNWGKEPEEYRRELIKNLPQDISLLATFEMYEVLPDKFPNHQAFVPDYTITFPGPGKYFSSEADEASKRKLPLYAMTNTGGRTWDCGVVPYIPAPMQWAKRLRAVVDSAKNQGLCGLMESHHFGWHPCMISECAKHLFLSPEKDPLAILREIAERDYGNEAAEDVMEAWQKWSEAVDSYIPGFDDQTGPLRNGAAYPLLFRPILHPHNERELHIPFPDYAHVYHYIVNELYKPEVVYNSAHCGLRMQEDIRILETTLKLYEEGVSAMEKALEKVPEEKKDFAEKELGVAVFFGCALRTMYNTKKWWVGNMRLELEADFGKANALMDELEKIVEDEYANALRALPLAEKDSRLGWEPRMEYVGDADHIRWKLKQLDTLRESTMKAYRKSLCRYPNM